MLCKPAQTLKENSFGLKNQGTNFGLQSEGGYPRKERVREGKPRVVCVSFAQTLVDP